jgi:hypothetical protein
MRQPFKKSRFVLLVGLPSLLLACSDSTDPPGSTIFAGNYVATFFVTTGTSGQTNQIAAGSTLTLNLAANGTTSGHLHLAAQGGAGPFDADMAGTWTANANVVDISQTADTFVRDMPFTWGPDNNGVASLSGDQVFSGTRIQIILTKAP